MWTYGSHLFSPNQKTETVPVVHYCIILIVSLLFSHQLFLLNFPRLLTSVRSVLCSMTMWPIINCLYISQRDENGLSNSCYYHISLSWWRNVISILLVFIKHNVVATVTYERIIFKSIAIISLKLTRSMQILHYQSCSAHASCGYLLHSERYYVCLFILNDALQRYLNDKWSIIACGYQLL